ncbi:winged helix-turn-helix transcriptional regulator [Candidatus Bathyarchaeota archaeon]|nr:winged helix-turn-helix transcriptional regulator [Candidatus Bathyarchaeota archaeon]
MNRNKKLRKIITLGLFSCFLVGLMGITTMPKASGWDVTGVEIDPGVNEDIMFNNVIFHVESNVSVVLNLNVDNKIHHKELYMHIYGTDDLFLDIDVKSDFSEKHLRLGSNVDIPGNDKQFRYSFGFAIGMDMNDSSAIIQYGANIADSGAKEKLRWISRPFSDSESDVWQLENSSLAGDYLYTTIEGPGYFTIVEERTGFSWISVLVMGIIAGISTLLILMISKVDYFRNIAAKLRSENIPVHRMSLEQVLEHEIRKEIIGLVFANPGIHLNELMRKLELTTGELGWHLDVLEHYKIIKKEKIGRYMSYFPRLHIKRTFPLYKEATMVTKNEKRLKILQKIRENGKMYQSELSRELQVEKRSIRYHANRLEKDGWIRFVERDGKKYHELTENGRDLLETIKKLAES